MARIVLAALATYRIVHAVMEEEGPFGIFSTLQGVDVDQRTWVGRGLRCRYCLSVWASVIVAFVQPWQGWRGLVRQAVEIAGATFALYKIEERLRHE